MGHPALELASLWVELGLSIETEISGRAPADRYYIGPGGLWWSNVLNSALPPQRLRPDTRPELQDPVSHTLSRETSGRNLNKAGFLAVAAVTESLFLPMDGATSCPAGVRVPP